jgi:response regulator RpfG family c-di-GMP phosphodiesterase
MRLVDRDHPSQPRARVIVDEAMPGATGLDVLTQTRAVSPGTRLALLVAAAIGEGSVCIRLVHQQLAATS